MKDKTYNGPYSLKYFRDVVGGFDHEICIKCSYQPFIGSIPLYDIITKTQNYRVKVSSTTPDCTNVLVANTATETYLETTLAYDQSTNDHEDITNSLTGFLSWDDHF